jgi:hypothetical protein
VLAFFDVIFIAMSALQATAFRFGTRPAAQSVAKVKGVNMVKRWPAALGVSLSLTVLAIILPAPGQAQEDVSVQGEILDMACYMAKGSKGAAHKACAVMCAKKGVPIGVLTDAGEVYLLLDDHNNPDPYDAVKKLAGERAQIDGKKYDKQGVASIVVSNAKGL